MPPTIEVSVRAWCHEDIVGQYNRVEGKEADDRPIYLKPASSMKHLGAKGRDMYIRYSAQAGDGQGGWMITPLAHRKVRYDPRQPSKSVIGAANQAKQEDREAISMAACTRTSPDQVPAGLWSFRSRESRAWTPDTTVEVSDAGQPRGSGLLTVEPLQLRRTFDAMKEALGLCWREGDAEGRPPEDVRLASCAAAGDATHMGGEGRFKSVGTFTQETNGYVFLQLPAARKAESPEPVLRLTAWEPVCVTLLYCDKTEEDKAPPVIEEPPPEAPPKGKAKDKGKGKAKEEAEAEPAPPPEPPKEPHVMCLEAAGFRPPPAAPTRPELEGLPEVKDILCRCFPRGKVEFPVPPGPGKLKLAPMVFVRAQVCAQTGSSGAACEVAKAKAGEPLVFAEPEEQRGETPDAGAAVPPPAGEAAAVPAPAQGPTLQSAGELGYNGYSFLRGPMSGHAGEEGEVLMNVDTGDQIQIILAHFRLPPPPATPAEGEEAERPAEVQEPPAAPAAPSEPPEWVDEDDWDEYDCKIPLTILTERAEQVTAGAVYQKTILPGEEIAIRGAGQEVLSVAFLRRVGDARPDPLRTMLMKKPWMMATGDRMAGLHRHLRIELGEALARQVLMTTVDAWPGLCIDGSDAAIDRWIQGHKLDALAREVEDRSRAKALLQQPGVASATAEQLAERCATLREVLGGSKPMLDVLKRHPWLWASEASTLASASRELSGALGAEAARLALRQRPEFLNRAPELSALLGALREHFPEIAKRRLRKRTEGQWARWPEFVGKPREAVREWMGRLAAEERAGRCQGPPSSPARSRGSEAASEADSEAASQ